jgi:hypothetical protein
MSDNFGDQFELFGARSSTSQRSTLFINIDSARYRPKCLIYPFHLNVGFPALHVSALLPSLLFPVLARAVNC